jgi:hypothetical protein
MNWRGCEGSVPRNFPEGTEENHENPQPLQPVSGPRFEPGNSQIRRRMLTTQLWLSVSFMSSFYTQKNRKEINTLRTAHISHTHHHTKFEGIINHSVASTSEIRMVDTVVMLKRRATFSLFTYLSSFMKISHLIHLQHAHSHTHTHDSINLI